MLCAAEGGSVFSGVPQPRLGHGAPCLPAFDGIWAFPF